MGWEVEGGSQIWSGDGLFSYSFILVPDQQHHAVVALGAEAIMWGSDTLDYTQQLT